MILVPLDLRALSTITPTHLSLNKSLWKEKKKIREGKQEGEEEMRKQVLHSKGEFCIRGNVI